MTKSRYRSQSVLGVRGRAEQAAARAVAQGREQSALAEAAKEVRVVEKHRENWQDSERTAERRRERKLGDEIAALLRRGRPPGRPRWRTCSSCRGG